jgi:hypothetical protein
MKISSPFKYGSYDYAPRSSLQPGLFLLESILSTQQIPFRYQLPLFIIGIVFASREIITTDWELVFTCQEKTFRRAAFHHLMHKEHQKFQKYYANYHIKRTNQTLISSAQRKLTLKITLLKRKIHNEPIKMDSLEWLAYTTARDRFFSRLQKYGCHKSH